MPKPRTRRGAGREEKKRKRIEEAEQQYETYESENKRQRTYEDNDNTDGLDYQDGQDPQQNGLGEKEFFGMLAEEEQEYFRRADELLELNQFPSTEDRDIFLENVWKEAEGKELKLASSQSCSRLMERLIQLSNTAQKKRLFEAFGGHFLSLVQHRFASHCCEALFLRSAGVVSQELSGYVLDTKGADVDMQKPEASMENLFLATLDELEGALSYLITDRFASHTLRVLLLVLAGRPLEDASVRSLVKSKKKEKISVAGGSATDEANQGLRAVPESFSMAAKKIIQDSTAGMDATALRVLARHPIGNPTLQLLLELDLTLNKTEQKAESEQPTLLFQLLPGAPKSLSDGASEASEFINGMIYDQIGSRLIETLITHCPGKVFKALNQNIFLPRIEGYVRNDVSCYAAIRVLNRLSKDDLVQAVEKITPNVPQLVAKSRLNVLKTLFERCNARGANDEIKKLNKGLKEGCGNTPADLVIFLCGLKDEEKKKKDVQQLSKNEYAIQSHGAQLLTTLLSIPGPTKGVQESLLALEPQTLVRLATTSMPTVTVLTTALATPSSNPAFHKSIASAILPHTHELAISQFGHNLINAIVEVPSKGKERSIPFHMKEAFMARLGDHEAELRDSWMGRSVWRNWKGDMWKTRRGDWKLWMREVDANVPSSLPQRGSKVAEREKPPVKPVPEIVEDHRGQEPAAEEHITEDKMKMDVDDVVEAAVNSEEEESKKDKKAKTKKSKKEKKVKKEKKEKKDKKNKKKKDKSVEAKADEETEE
ncbi:probable Nucleolar protein 9 [Fusarium mangiferae]|uniref:Nucleolar protein 9 n=1 Tax=Fusarium mangiferae TaxID=192010 RepID=A0A1L7SUF2_FUSMA|nr:putative Nucleolar protein 9 [Fusarium mangiferae]CVK89339.1 probable Nucleolar protein 9 [Fusarium mangiferae]